MPRGGEESASLPRGGRAAGEPGPQRRSWPVLRLCARPRGLGDVWPGGGAPGANVSDLGRCG